MPKLTIDGHEIEVEPGTSVLQACEQLGIEIPRFCYHDRLSVPANCRMCLVEMERAPKPIASCAMAAGEGMVISTTSERITKARKGVMEFLLINHPLDCPICDQGGECDLQDQAMAYGFDRGRFQENKRSVKDKNLGPLIKTYMTRCIHCTRCVRFADEIAGAPEMGATGRGENLEIGTYIEAAITSELSGNMIDICPVGALTSKPYAFAARPWELKKTQSIDVHDAVGSNIRVDSRGGEVMRVLPRLHEDVNEEWISDKTRFAYDGLRRQRLDRPYVRRDGRLQAVSWDEALGVVAGRLKGLRGSEIAAIAGDLCDVESIFTLRRLMESLGSENLDCRQDGAAIDPSVRASYVFNSGIRGIEEADAILIVGSNPRLEAAIVNARIRKRWLKGGLKIGVIGPSADLTYPTTHIGNGAASLEEVTSGRHSFSEVLKNAARPMVIIGQGALARTDGWAVLSSVRSLAEKFDMVREGWNGFNVLHTAAARVGGLDAGFVPGPEGLSTREIVSAAENGDVKALWLLGADEIDTSKLGDAFVIYQGTHGDRGAHRADVILPGAAYTEKNGLYVNTEGRVQRGRMAIFPPGEAREDWKIHRALSQRLGKTLPFDTLNEVREALALANPVFAELDVLQLNEWGDFGMPGSTESVPFSTSIDVFYLTNPIARASETMVKCVEEFLGRAEAAE